MVDTIRREAPAPDDTGKPGEITDLTKRSWFYVLRQTIRQFSADACTDLAAALTYYSVLAIFPGLLAVLSILGLGNAGGDSVNTILDILKPFVDGSTLDSVRKPLEDLASSHAAGYAFVLGLLGALWSASGYIGAFSRAMNRVYGVQEGRPMWKLRPLQLGITVITVLLSVVALVILLVSGPVARSVGKALHIGNTAVDVWSIAKWPVLAAVVVLVMALLYYLTPNVRQPRFRWVSAGAVVAIVFWAIVSVGFAFYVANFSSYNKTYGSLAGVIVALLWLWLTNLALLFGAELDAELERGRELQAGLPAEDELQLPLRDDSGVRKAERKHRAAVDEGRELREEEASEDSAESDSNRQAAGKRN